jgi:mevalonate kinase
MKWHIPAKTFLLGEYAAVREGSALLVTTSPHFEISLGEDEARTDSTNPRTVTSETELLSKAIHPQSPAGLWWHYQQTTKTLHWHDPYHGRGGLGASSAQFIGSYLASCFFKKIPPSIEDMLEAYYQCAWNGQGLRPSGYDLIAQTLYGCVYINKQKQHIKTYHWPFNDISFLLVHTGVKLATHHHLQKAAIPQDTNHLSVLVDKAMDAFKHSTSHLLIECINNYHLELAKINLVAEHTLDLITQLKNYPEVLAAKGCGALGADILLIITTPQHRDSLSNKLSRQNKIIVASDRDLSKERENILIF